MIQYFGFKYGDNPSSNLGMKLELVECTMYFESDCTKVDFLNTVLCKNNLSNSIPKSETFPEPTPSLLLSECCCAGGILEINLQSDMAK